MAESLVFFLYWSLGLGLLEEEDVMESKQIVIVVGLLFGPTNVAAAHVSSRIDNCCQLFDGESIMTVADLRDTNM